MIKPRKERIIAPWLLGLLAVMLAFALYAMRPNQESMAQMLAVRAPSTLAVAYLRNWLRIKPDSPRLMGLLAEQYIGLGRWDDAKEIAVQLTHLEDEAYHQEGIHLHLLAIERHAYEFPPEDERRVALVAELDGMLQTLARSEDDLQTLAYLASRAQSMGTAQTNWQIYDQLAHKDPERAADWYSLQGQRALADGWYEQSAQAHFNAQSHAASREDKRKHFLAAIAALREENQVALACDEAQKHLGDLADDPGILRHLIGLAREAGRYDLMRKYGASLSELISTGPRYMDGLRGAVRMGWASPGRLHRVAAQSGDKVFKSSVAADLDLLYRTFLESGALSDAMATAQRALARTDVDQRIWLTRLGLTAEWNNQPGVALKAWQTLAKKYNDEHAWREVQRIAPQLNADGAWLDAMYHAAAKAPGDIRLTTEVILAYERVGDPDGGLAFLKHLGTQNREVLELQAGLAERSGHDDLALQTWQTLDRRYGPSPLYALHIATLLYALDEPKQALAALKAVRAVAQEQQAPDGFWRVYASLAQVLGDQDGQNVAAAAMLEQSTTPPADFNTLIAHYDGFSIDGGRIAETAFHQIGDVQYLTRAVTAYTQVRAWARVRRLLGGLSAAQLQAAEQSWAFLEARAGYRQAANDPQGALSDLAFAYRLPGRADSVEQSYLWALLSFGTRDEVRLLANEIAKHHGSQPEYAPVLAAAMLQLDQPQRAMVYMNMAGVPAMQDPLWLTGYASVQDALGHPDMAWRIRRRAWRLLVSKYQNLRTLDEQASLVSLGQSFRSGDVSLVLLLALLSDGPVDGPRQAVARSILGDVPGIPRLAEIAWQRPAGTRENGLPVDADVYALTVSWAMDGGHDDLARVWLADRYVSDMLKPANARLALALLDDDQALIASLLAEDPADLSGDDRVQGLARLGHDPEAQTEAFHVLAGSPANDVHYESWKEEALKRRPSAGLRVEYASLRPLETTTVFADIGLQLTNRLGLKLRHVERFHSSLDREELVRVPRRDHESSIALLHADANHHYEFELGRRDGLDSQTTGLLTAAWALDDQMNLTLQAGANRYTDIDALMAIGGSKDFVSAELSWDSQRDWFAGLGIERARYQTQPGTRLGNGSGYMATVGYHLRKNGLPIDLSAYVSRWNYAGGSGPVPEFARFMPDGEAPDIRDILPQDTTQYGLTLTIGNELMTEYQRGWQPHLAVSMVHDSLQGWGPGVSAGIGGSLLGRDRLGLYVTHEPASRNDGQRTTRAGLYYRFFY